MFPVLLKVCFFSLSRLTGSSSFHLSSPKDVVGIYMLPCSYVVMLLTHFPMVSWFTSTTIEKTVLFKSPIYIFWFLKITLLLKSFSFQLECIFSGVCWPLKTQVRCGCLSPLYFLGRVSKIPGHSIPTDFWCLFIILIKAPLLIHCAYEVSLKSSLYRTNISTSAHTGLLLLINQILGEGADSLAPMKMPFMLSVVFPKPVPVISLWFIH